MNESSPSRVAYEAREKADRALREVEQHEDVCAERYANIHKAIAEMEGRTKEQISEIKGILKWAGGVLVTIIIALIAFLARVTFDAADVQQKAAAAKIEALERNQRQVVPAPVATPQP